MSDQEQEAPAWHAIVGEDWESVRFGDSTKRNDHVLESQGWIAQRDGGGFVYAHGMQPRRRRKRLYDVRAISGGVTYCHINAAKPGDCFRLTEHGELIQIEVDE